MNLWLDTVTLAATDVQEAGAFYTGALSPGAVDHGESIDLDMHGTGRFALAGTEALAADAGVAPATSGFRGFVLTYNLDQPTEVKAVMEAAVENGAELLKPAKKALFGSFSGAFRAPDGSVWKLAAGTGKDTGPAAEQPRPTETTVILGVQDPKASKTFYEALGMKTERDYGSKYLDFHPAEGSARLCLMQREVLAKDAGVTHAGSGFPAMVLGHRAESSAEVDALLAAAASAGGRVTVPAGRSEDGYCGYFTDPDGFSWRLTA
jgi:uncharacterized protein